MNEKEIREMQRRIDEGIRIAQERLWQRASHNRQTLVVAREGKIVEFVPNETSQIPPSAQGDPLLTRQMRREG